jgi:hypothetical protein
MADEKKVEFCEECDADERIALYFGDFAKLLGNYVVGAVFKKEHVRYFAKSSIDMMKPPKICARCDIRYDVNLCRRRSELLVRALDEDWAIKLCYGREVQLTSKTSGETLTAYEYNPYEYPKIPYCYDCRSMLKPSEFSNHTKRLPGLNKYTGETRRLIVERDISCLQIFLRELTSDEKHVCVTCRSREDIKMVRENVETLIRALQNDWTITAEPRGQIVLRSDTEKLVLLRFHPLPYK